MSGEIVRVSDAEREQSVASLREHLVQGRLSLEEFTQRMTSAYASTTSTDLAELQRDLPSAARPEPRRSALGHLIAVFGSAKRTGSLRVQQQLRCVAVFGSVTLDLRGALIEGDEVRVRAFTAFGSVEVIVPKGVEVDLTGLALFGSKETRGEPGTLRRGAALVRVNAFVLFGSTEVKVKEPQ